MSSHLNRKVGPDDPSAYAPKWARDLDAPGRRRPLGGEGAVDLDAVPRAHANDDPAADAGLTIDGVRVPRSLEPTVLSESWPAPPRRGFGPGMLGGVALASVLAAAVAFIVVGKLQAPPAAGPSGPAAEPSPAVSQPAAPIPAERAASIPPERQVGAPPPQLVVTQAGPSAADEALRLGISLSRATEGAVLFIGGLAPGSALSAGRPIGGNGWRLSAAEFENAVVTPPRGFAGIMDLVLELRLADDSVADRRTLRVEWAARTPSQPSFVGRRLDAGEVTALLKRGGQFAAKGDLAAARLLFQRAAEAGDPRAAFALAETYDPIALQRWGEHGFAPDIAMARTWYERAKEFGSSEAAQRLQTLASQNR